MGSPPTLAGLSNLNFRPGHARLPVPPRPAGIAGSSVRAPRFYGLRHSRPLLPLPT